MEGQNNQNFETAENNEVKEKIKKTIPKKTIIIASIVAGIILLGIIVFLIIYAVSCHHYEKTYSSMPEPTCTTEGKRVYVCKDCGKECYSQVLPVTGHSWADATCEKPQTCTNCNITQGNVGSHKWIEATCAEAKHCYYCGKEEGTPTDNHDYYKGKCSVCYRTMELNIILPEVPITVSSNGKICKITDFTYKVEFDNNESFDLYLYYSGEMIYNPKGSDNSDYVRFELKIVDSEGYVITNKAELTPTLCVGDKFKNYKAGSGYPIGYNLNPNETYTIIIID